MRTSLIRVFTVTSLACFAGATAGLAAPSISNISVNTSNIPRYEKFEITFAVNTVAQNLFLPYDPNPPQGVAPGQGVTVDAEFSPDNWATVYTQPAFYYQDFTYQAIGGQDWIYPTTNFSWKVRFAPPAQGTWRFRLKATDTSGSVTSPDQSFTVTASTQHGFIRVSSRDSRYFEFEDGTYFPSLGYNMNFDRISWNNPVQGNVNNFQKMGQNGIQVVRSWIPQWGIFGSVDNPWRSMNRGANYESIGAVGVNDARVQGYLPYPGSETAMILESGWNPSMFIGWMKDGPEVKPNTRYHIFIRYLIPQDLAPVDNAKPYGLVAKTGGWIDTPETPGLGTVVSSYAPSSPKDPQGKAQWAVLTGTLTTTGGQNFLPYFYLTLENAIDNYPAQGVFCYIDRVDVLEDLGGGQHGPNIINKPWMSHHLYVDQKYSYGYDRVLDLAKQNGVYIKLVGLEKNDGTLNGFSSTGTFTGWSNGNVNFYGNFGAPTKTLWHQQSWWRYMQARWGYSTNIHSWELLNEGDPWNGRHYALAQAMAQYMKQFRPNHHMATTSFWGDVPRDNFWANAAYPDIDYADIHHYIFQDSVNLTIRINNSFPAVAVAPGDFNDSASPVMKFSKLVGAKHPTNGANKPVMRGETGFVVGTTDGWQNAIRTDTQGIWLHKFVWAGMNPGGVIECYWYDTEHIYPPGKDFRPAYGRYYRFIKDIPLSNGNYVDSLATTTVSGLRVIGQKDLTAQRAHLWIDNMNHTWINVTTGAAIPTVSGNITIPGLAPNTNFSVQWWDPYAGAAADPVTSTTNVTSNGSGVLTLAINNLAPDVAVKIAPTNPANQVPSVSIVSPVNGSTVTAPANLTITANASDSDGSIDRVLFFRNGIFISSSAMAPYAASFVTSSTGTYLFTAVAYDNSGSSATSAAARVFVAPNVAAKEWYMSGANPERTGWVSEEVPGQLAVDWYANVDDYIIPYTQVIAADGKIFLATSRGLLAFDASTGLKVWDYATEMPLGNSPTYDATTDSLFVGGYDRRIHQLAADTGVLISRSPVAGAGFNTNPLLVNGLIYMGNRDGFFYSWSPGAASWANQYPAAGQAPLAPINYSAAYDSVKNQIYFASDNGIAYALSTDLQTLKWSKQLPGSGFHSWWPVVYSNPSNPSQRRVIFSGGTNYRPYLNPGALSAGGSVITPMELAEIYQTLPNKVRGEPVGPAGTDPWVWAVNTPTIDAFRITNYLTSKPQRRMYVVLNADTGVESEIAPVAWTGTQSGNRYPPVVGGDGVLYQQNNLMYDDWIAGGGVSGWKFGTSIVSQPNSEWKAVDEPMAFAAGGNMLYVNLGCDRTSNSIDLLRQGRGANMFHYNPGLLNQAPGYTDAYGGVVDCGIYGDANGIYGKHGDQNPPIPYNGRVYMHRGNSLISFKAGGVASKKPTATFASSPAPAPSRSATELRNLLDREVQKMIAAGSLRPSYITHGYIDSLVEGDRLVDYWHHPFDTLYTLIRAYSQVPAARQAALRAYIKSEFQSFPPHQFNSRRWGGASRDFTPLPSDVQNLPTGGEAQTFSYTAQIGGQSVTIWNVNPQSIYAVWMYANFMTGDATANPTTLLQNVQANASLMADLNRANAGTLDAYMIQRPLVMNAYIAGYVGYLNLAQLAGNTTLVNQIQPKLDRLLTLRKNNYSKDTLFTGYNYNRALNLSRNFMTMVPELSTYLRQNVQTPVQDTVTMYDKIAPYWFVPRFEAQYLEGVFQPLHDVHALFQAKAQILQESTDELSKFIESPATAVGDLYFIDNIVSALNNSSAPANVAPTVSIVAPVNGSSATVPVSVTITANASDADGSIALVAFYRNGVFISSATTAPYSATFFTSSSGTFVLTAIAYDNNSMSSMSSGVSVTVAAAAQGSANDWPMAGANPQRTSWSPEQILGTVRPIWAKPFEPYIQPKTQLIAANGSIFVATARGLYAIDANSGSQQWTYPTQVPLGNSPTFDSGVLYVGGLDKRIHAVNAMTGAKLWTFPESDPSSPKPMAGFTTNPLVVNGIIYMGCRDGYFYAVDTSGKLKWRTLIGQPILYSAAYHNGKVYFAAQDSFAYALDAQTGSQVWKSPKLPGGGFQSWWPVVYRNRVIFSGSKNYRQFFTPGIQQWTKELERGYLYANNVGGNRGDYYGTIGQEPGDWAPGTKTMDAQRAIDLFTQKPWLKSYIVLDINTGQEAEIAPVGWSGTGSGNRYPPMVGSDGVIYQMNSYMYDPYIAGGHVSGWKIGTPYISIISRDWGAVDEPIAFAGSGNAIQWNICCDREAGAYNTAIPVSSSAAREWTHYDYNLATLAPNYDHAFDGGAPWGDPFYGLEQSFGGMNGIYGKHGDQSPPIPYNGKIYALNGNSLIAFKPAPTGIVYQALPTAGIVNVNDPAPAMPETDLRAILDREVQKMVNAGHLRPGYNNPGDTYYELQINQDYFLDYFHYPYDTLYTLIRAYPYLSPALQSQTSAYIRSEFTNYPPYQINHIGWNTGAPREAFDIPAEVQPGINSFGTRTNSGGFAGWTFNPQSFYAMWKYAELFGGATQIYNLAKNQLNAAPSDTLLITKPYICNAFIAGYMGYLELQRLAGVPETASVRTELNRLMALRAANVTKDTPYTLSDNLRLRLMNSFRNFLYLTPELANYLGQNARPQVQATVDEYNKVTPYWFVSNFEATLSEATISLLHNTSGLFQAKAMILDEPSGELRKYLDSPGFATGDLYYIQNLVSLLETTVRENASAAPPARPRNFRFR